MSQISGLFGHIILIEDHTLVLVSANLTHISSSKAVARSTATYLNLRASSYSVLEESIGASTAFTTNSSKSDDILVSLFAFSRFQRIYATHIAYLQATHIYDFQNI